MYSRTIEGTSNLKNVLDKKKISDHCNRKAKSKESNLLISLQIKLCKTVRLAPFLKCTFLLFHLIEIKTFFFLVCPWDNTRNANIFLAKNPSRLQLHSSLIMNALSICAIMSCYILDSYSHFSLLIRSLRMHTEFIFKFVYSLFIKTTFPSKLKFSYRQIKRTNNLMAEVLFNLQLLSRKYCRRV